MKLRFNGDTRNFPDFLVVGAPKCGTTSLHHYLTDHPDVFLPEQKELRFWHQNRNPSRALFNFLPPEYIPTDLSSYLDWFNDAKQEQIAGEICVSYMYYHDFVIPSLKEFHPKWEQVKIVMILRDPLERIFSQYRAVRHKDQDPERLSFESSIREEPRRKEDDCRFLFFYVSLSLYARQVKAYLDTFPNVKILLYEELVQDPVSLMRDLCGFLGIDQDWAKSLDYSKKYNVSGNARNDRFGGATATFGFLRELGKRFPAAYRRPVKKVFNRLLYTKQTFDPDLVDPKLIEDLKEKLRPEVEKVAELTGRDLSCWSTVQK